MAKPKVVIIGGGFGGLKAARRLSNGGGAIGVTVIDRRNHHLFQPLLYQVATAGLNPSDIAFPIRSVFRRQKNVDVLMAEVTGVDTQAKRVLTDAGPVPYDYLIVATGSLYNYFGRDEWAADAPNLKSVNDAIRIRERILLAFEKADMEADPEIRNRLLTFVLVGAGPTGVEMAGAIAELAHRALETDFRHIEPGSARVILLDATPRILNAFPEPLAEYAQGRLRDLGVEVRTDTKVDEVDADGVTASGERIPAGTVIWTAGVKASPAAQWLGAESDKIGRVKVKPDLSLPGHPEVFVIGDTALVNDEHGKPLPGLAPVAMQQGHHAAGIILNALGRDTSRPPFVYYDKGNMATIGRSAAIVDLGRMHMRGLLAWLTWLAVHIFYLIGFRNRLFVMLEWAWAYLTFQRGARLITKSARNVERS